MGDNKRFGVPRSFNRTILELKPNSRNSMDRFVTPFNRTILELKQEVVKSQKAELADF